VILITTSVDLHHAQIEVAGSIVLHDAAAQLFDQQYRARRRAANWRGLFLLRNFSISMGRVMISRKL
jgi:hypothetical protein